MANEKAPIYLDYAAATPMDSKVLKAMQPYFADKFYNPSALYLAAKEVNDELWQARQAIAKWLGCQSAEIIFTAGGTEANNLAIRGVMETWPKKKLIYSAIEHESVIKPSEKYQSQPLPVDKQGVIDLKALEKHIDDQTVLVSVMYANNEIGTIQPLREISQIVKNIQRQRVAKGINLPLYFHTDACQAASLPDLNVHSLGVDLLTLNGGKIYGPKQSGMLFVKAGTKLSPQILGGGQEYGMRSGTENVSACIGLAQALDLVQTKKQAEVKRLSSLQKLFIKKITEYLPQAKINGSQTKRLANNIHVTFPGQDNERLLMELDEKGVICAVGSACSASSEEPSHVLTAIGMDEPNIRSSLRFTTGKFTTEKDILTTASALKVLVS